jgi:dTDP-4-amino-4,6-dideoxygalactose transaminase
MLFSANPHAGYLAHKSEIDFAMRNVMENGRYILGPKVRDFEVHFAKYLGVDHCIGVANGTDAVHLSLRACGVKTGDGVITASHTAVATVAAVEWLGAIPVLVDIDPESYTLDPQKVEDTLRERKTTLIIKAIIAVHLYGHPSDMNALRDVADRYGVVFIEDCAQAHGAAFGDRKAGSMGECGAFSFYPTKNLGAFGDGGAIVTVDAGIAERLRSLQQYGWRERYISEDVGYNSRLDELQAAVLDVKLQWLDAENEQRRRIAALYNDGLSGMPFDLPREKPRARHVYHQYVIQSAERDKLRLYLESHGIQTSILYPMAVHQQPAYRNRLMVGEGGMAVTETIVQRILGLPIYPELGDAEVERVVENIRSYFKK